MIYYEIYFNGWRPKNNQYVVVKVTNSTRESGYQSTSSEEVMSFSSFEDALAHVNTFTPNTTNSYGLKVFSEIE